MSEYDDYLEEYVYKYTLIDYMHKYRIIIFFTACVAVYSFYSYVRGAQRADEAEIAGFVSVEEMDQANLVGVYNKSTYERYLKDVEESQKKKFNREYEAKQCETYRQVRDECATAGDMETCMKIRAPSCAGEELIDSSRKLSEAYKRFYNGATN